MMYDESEIKKANRAEELEREIVSNHKTMTQYSNKRNEYLDEYTKLVGKDRSDKFFIKVLKDD